MLRLVGVTVFGSAITMSGSVIDDYKNSLYIGTRPYPISKGNIVGVITGRSSVRRPRSTSRSNSPMARSISTSPRPMRSPPSPSSSRMDKEDLMLLSLKVPSRLLRRMGNGHGRPPSALWDVPQSQIHPRYSLVEQHVTDRNRPSRTEDLGDRFQKKGDVVAPWRSSSPTTFVI